MTLPFLVLVGPTAVGKSAVAERIAKNWGTDILVADSRQIYQGMDIGTNKPTADAQQQVARRLIDLAPPDVPFSAGAYVREAEKVIAGLEAQGKPIVLEGGTGLYIKALLYGLWKGPPADPELRKQLLAMEQEAGTLHRRLTEGDPVSAEKINVRDIPKIVRALEVLYTTGRPLSTWHAEHRFKKKRCFHMIGLTRERADLYRRIEARVEDQFKMGLIEETRRLLATVSPCMPSMLALGYRQIVPYLQGVRTIEETVTLLKRDTRHYAKRQMTWFRADPNVTWITLTEKNDPHETALHIMKPLEPQFRQHGMGESPKTTIMSSSKIKTKKDLP